MIFSAHLAAPLAGVPQLQAGDGDAALVLLVVAGVAQAGVQVIVTILLDHIALQTTSGQLLIRTEGLSSSYLRIFPLEVTLALPVCPAAVFPVAVCPAHQGQGVPRPVNLTIRGD